MLLSEALGEFDLSLAGIVADSTRKWYRHRVGSLVMTTCELSLLIIAWSPSL